MGPFGPLSKRWKELRQQLENLPDSPIRDTWSYGSIVTFTDHEGDDLEISWGEIEPLFESLDQLTED
jgi:hypothetical protein